MRYFDTSPVQLGKSRRNFLLFPVKLQAGVPDVNAVTTDKVLVYLQDGIAEGKAFFHDSTMLLTWVAPGAKAGSAALSGNALELENFRQTDSANATLTVRYNLTAPKGAIRVRVLHSQNAAVVGYFEACEQDIKAGRGAQTLGLTLSTQATLPTSPFATDTLEITLVDGSGQVLTTLKKDVNMQWEKPR
jgi:hypothetical protein